MQQDGYEGKMSQPSKDGVVGWRGGAQLLDRGREQNDVFTLPRQFPAALVCALVAFSM